METVSFKVCLCRPGAERQEVRRFVVGKNMSTSFSFLQKKLCTVFPDLKNESFTVEWKDEDGDDVIISSDEELMIALKEMKGDLYKLHVSVTSQCSASAEEECPSEGKEKGGKHSNIVCDGCNGGIHGYRYKCMQCVDYDLCSDCEKKGLHSGHNMIRIASPSMWCPNFGNRFQRMHARMHSKQGKAHKGENKEETGTGPKNWGPFFGGYGGWRSHCNSGTFKGYEGGAFKGYEGPCGSWSYCSDPWCQMSSGWMGAGAPGNNAEEQTKSETKTESSSTEGAGAGPECHTKTAEEAADFHQDFLKNVGQRVAAFLDPLGIDVQVDIEHDGHRQTCSGRTDEFQKPKEDEPTGEDRGKNKTPNEEETGEKSITKERENMEDGESHDTSLTKDEPTAEGEKNKMDKSGSPSDGEDWTVVDEDRSPDPHIQDALQKMMSMGFTNEGGWLTQLLEVKQGDIGKVLDILQPVKPGVKKA